MPGLIEAFNVAKRGMNAQQTALQVTGHNVANANTDGYSIQRANLKTSDPFGMPSLNSAGTVGQLGTGVLVDSITRSRDEFLDAQIQKESSTLNMYTSREQFLSEIESVLVEPSDTGLSKLMSNYWDSWNGLSTTPESGAARKLVVSSGDSLATGIRHNYQQLCDMEASAAGLLQQQTFEASSFLKQIADLNTQIKAATIGGQTPNDLMDRRDLLLDTLSKKFDFDVDKTDFNGISIKAKGTKGNDRVNIDLLSDANVNKGFAFVNDISITYTDKDGKDQTAKLKDFPTKIDDLSKIKEFKLEIFVDGDRNKPETVSIDVSDKSKIEATMKQYLNYDGTNKMVRAIEPHIALYDVANYKNNQKIQTLEPVNFTSGSLQGYESVNHEINEYKDELNNLAKVLVVSVNTLHSNSSDYTKGAENNFFTSTLKDKDGNYISIEDPTSRASFEAAKYIAMSDDLKKDPEKIHAGMYLDGNAGNGDRAVLIGQLRNTRLDVLNVKDRKDFIKDAFGMLDADVANVTTENSKQPTDPKNPSKGNLSDKVNTPMTGNLSKSTMDTYYKSTISKLGVSNQEAKRMEKNQTSLLSQLVSRRESVSGVSIDEEVTNMMQFQRAYQANAKMISVIDELLDVVVNGLMKR